MDKKRKWFSDFLLLLNPGKFNSNFPVQSPQFSLSTAGVWCPQNGTYVNRAIKWATAKRLEHFYEKDDVSLCCTTSSA